MHREPDRPALVFDRQEIDQDLAQACQQISQ
jgi:hypothetical protein